MGSLFQCASRPSSRFGRWSTTPASAQARPGRPRPGRGKNQNSAADHRCGPAAATHLVVTTEPPSSVTAGSGFSLKVSAEDAYRREKGTSLMCAAKKVLVFSGCNSHPATGSLQPVAIGAAVEVTKPSEPSRQMCRFGDAASRQAVTRVNVEQASKRPMWSPTLHQYGEGRRRWG